MPIVFVLVATLVLAVIVTANWYVWRRLFRDTTRGPGLTRRAGAVLIAGGWTLAITALVAERSGAPFWLQQVLAWPGFLWLALSIYLLLAVVAGEVVRPVLRRFLERRARSTTGPGPHPDMTADPEGNGSAGAPAGAAAPQTYRDDAVPAGAASAGPQGEGGAGAPRGASAVTTVAASQGDGDPGAPRAATAAASQVNPGGAASAPASTAGPQEDGDAGGPAGAPAAATAAASQVDRGDGVAGPHEDGGAGASGVVAAAGPQADGGVVAPASLAAASSPGAPHPQTDNTPEGSSQPLTAPAPSGPSRRLFVSRVVAGAAAAAAVGTVGYGTYGVLRGPKVKRVTVPLAKLPRAAHGYRIAVVSDVHLGPVLGRGFAQKVVDTINATQPDLIAVVGDLVDGSVKDLGPAAAPLAQLRARHGSYFVTGNHEYFSGAEQWVEEVRRLGLDPLENARRELPHFDLAGVNDLTGEDEGQGPDYARALGDRDTARACVLLAHQPVQIHDAVEHGVDLQLSGHTHGGQLWPGNLLAAAANPTVAGLERYGDTQLYVSRGAGAWGPPTRVGAPSDITLVELASRQA
ncbi:metallophosphoesterase [Streptomyces coeruleorubidus]|uniref:metallophosphoesterase n=1 Tax=Streptomyces coeruleorubidus TaxID=116188 RepID=UPI00237F3148|nr:metallophosphoesterase [Streptomyces coeruleorubidus]WDV54034.1 metallophosphoesterase [Streptomyces coeruleorubidus]